MSTDHNPFEEKGKPKLYRTEVPPEEIKSRKVELGSLNWMGCLAVDRVQKRSKKRDGGGGGSK